MRDGESTSIYSVEYSLLGLLNEHPMHGYELHRELSRKTGIGLIWTVKQALLYAILSKLEARGLIVAQVLVQENRPVRKVFHLTEEGQSAFEDWVSTPSSRKDFKLDFLAKLHFARKKGRKSGKGLLAKQRALCVAWIAEIEERERAAKKEGVDALVFRYRIGQLKATLAWLDECKAYLDGRS